MKEQIAVAVVIPSTIVNIKVDFHGIEVALLHFDLDSLLTGSDVTERTLYLAMDKCGDLSWYQYPPSADTKYGDFDPGNHPDNALDGGNYDLVCELEASELPVAWDESVIKYTIAKESV